MKVLLDTHIWLWYLLDDRRLAKSHRALMLDERAELWLSPISVWEAWLLIEKERLHVPETPGEWMRMAMESLPVREARLSFAIATRSRRVRLTYEDPADRFIAATAAEMNLPLVTADARLLACADIQCVR